MKTPKIKPKHGGRRPGSGRKPIGTIPGRQLPWRIPGDDYERTVAAVKALTDTDREPGRVIVEAIETAAKVTKNKSGTKSQSESV